MTRVAAEPVFREDFRALPAHIPLASDDLSSEFLGLELIGPGAPMVKLSHHPEVTNDPHYVWNGQCAGPVLIAFPMDHAIDLSAVGSKVSLRSKNVGRSSLHLALRCEGRWVVSETGLSRDSDWTKHELQIANLSWRALRKDQVSMRAKVLEPNLNAVDGIGFLAPLKPNGGKDCIRLDWFEVESTSAKLQEQSVKKLRVSGFLEPETPFLRTALVGKGGDPSLRVRRGVVVPFGKGRWACFDPDLLRWAAVWDAGEGALPFSMDSMAAVSYPDKKAKAKSPPKLLGNLLVAGREEPGVSPSTAPLPDPRTTTLVARKDRVGALPLSFGRWSGISVVGRVPVLHYECGGRNISEIASFENGSFTRLLRISSGTKSLAIRISPEAAKTSGAGWAELSDVGLPIVSIAGDKADLRSSRADGTWVQVAPSQDECLIQISRSPNNHQEQGRLVFLDGSVAEPLFPEVVQVEGYETKVEGAFEVRPMSLPIPNRWNRAVRPTDLAFAPNGDAYLCTLDGDVWRVQGIDGEKVTWMRVATGLFESMNIEINDRGEIFVLGRDQITKLVDTNGDGHIDLYQNISDLFHQTLHTRDYSMSMQLMRDGSFLVAKSGLINENAEGFDEHSAHRGTILKISPDGRSVEVIADGLRLPYVGVRDGGAVFASDQQGNWIPSTPVHQIGEEMPFLGFQWGRLRKGVPDTEPLLWFPYQNSRSGAGFTTLSKKGFSDLGDRFAQVSWNGSLFPIETPEKGMPFAWRLPVNFEFPTLNAATHPLTGELYLVGLGISGYKPTTPKLSGLVGLRQAKAFPVPCSLEVLKSRIRVGFESALPEDCLPAVASLRLWDIKRTDAYGSGHFRWDGEPGEHLIEPEKVVVAEDRRSLDLIIPEIYRSEILVLTLQMMNKGSGQSETIELYAKPSTLDKASKRELADVRKREKALEKIEPGDAKRGKQVFVSYACVGCHSVNGEKLTGPPMNGVAERHAEGLDEFLRESILQPEKLITEGYEAAMPSFAGVIPAQELEDLIEYLKSLR